MPACQASAFPLPHANPFLRASAPGVRLGRVAISPSLLFVTVWDLASSQARAAALLRLLALAALAALAVGEPAACPAPAGLRHTVDMLVRVDVWVLCELCGISHRKLESQTLGTSCSPRRRAPDDSSDRPRRLIDSPGLSPPQKGGGSIHRTFCGCFLLLVGSRIPQARERARLWDLRAAPPRARHVQAELL